MKNVKFEDAVELSKIHVGSFQIPTQAELMQLEVGHVVKVCANNERFWTKIVQIDFDTEEIIATVDNKLLRNDLELFEKVKFKFNNIYLIYHLHT